MPIQPPDQVDVSRFLLVKELVKLPFTVEQVNCSTDLVVQRRKKEDGKLSREFLSVRITLGSKTIFIRPEVVPNLLASLTTVHGHIKPAQDTLDLENSARKAERKGPSQDKGAGPSMYVDNTNQNKTPKKKTKVATSKYSKKDN